MEEQKVTTKPVSAPVAPVAGGVNAPQDRGFNRAPRGAKPADGQGRGRGPRRGGDRRPREKERSEFDNKIVSIRRVARVVSGGKRFNFSVSIVIGDRKGRVGVGLGKAADTALAIEKAMRDAKKNVITIPLTETRSIPHEVVGKFGASRVTISPAPERGVIAGSSVRTVIELAGIKDIWAKIFSRSKNKLNNARVAIDALSKVKPVKK